MRLAAEHAAAAVPIPQDTGQHWAVWLQEWAAYNHDVFLARPALLAQYLDGAISMESIATDVDRILGVLVRQGFSIVDANAAYERRERVRAGLGGDHRASERPSSREPRSARAHEAIVAATPITTSPTSRRCSMRSTRAGRRGLAAARHRPHCAASRTEQGVGWDSVEAALADATQRSAARSVSWAVAPCRRRCTAASRRPRSGPAPVSARCSDTAPPERLCGLFVAVRHQASQASGPRTPGGPGRGRRQGRRRPQRRRHRGPATGPARPRRGTP